LVRNGQARTAMFGSCHGYNLGIHLSWGTSDDSLNFTAFYEALLEAKGLQLGDAPRTGKRRGREPSFHTRVQFNGNLMVGSAYTAQLGLKPGDPFEIRLGRRNIQLVPVGETETADLPTA
jgi:hypothetical protein